MTAKHSDCMHCLMRGRSIFAGLSREEVCELGMDVHDIHVPTGTPIYHEGDPAQYAYTLRQGGIKLVKSLPNGHAQIVRLLHHGDLLGFEGLRTDRHRHSAITLTGTDLCRLELRALDALSQRLPAVREAIFARWQQALQEAEDRIVELGAKKADARLATFLCQWVGAYPQQRAAPFPLTRQDLGEFLGLSTEHVSRIMADLKRHGLLHEHKGQIEIPDSRKLSLYAGSDGTRA